MKSLSILGVLCVSAGDKETKLAYRNRTITNEKFPVPKQGFPFDIPILQPDHIGIYKQ